MKKIIKKLKGKKVLSFVLAAIMLATTFNIALPELKLNASAVDLPRDAEGNVVLDGITQKRVVSGYESTYAGYANRFFGGDGKSEPTNFVIPGLSSANDYTPQGMTYWKAKDWILISAYDATGEGKHSVIYALDGKSTEFVALFKVLNADGSVNTSHGGGIAASEYNFYYADTDSKISYVPLNEMDVEPGTVKEIKLKGSINCAGELGGAATSYCCYDEGVLWTGNFYFTGDDRYKTPAYTDYPSVLMGYKLIGNSSEEEWAYLNGKRRNLLNVTTPSGTATTNGANLNWKAYKSGDFVDIVGSITAPTAYIGEFCPTFGSFELTEGKNYIIQYTTNANPDSCDFYMFAPNGGGHMDVKQAKDRKVTQLEDGRWHVSLEFTAGLKPTGADSSWPTTQSTNGTYTGTYTIRFDQDAIQAGEVRNFAFTDVSITEVDPGFVPANGFDYSIEYTDNTGGLKYSFSKNINGTLDITFDVQELKATNNYYYTSQFASFYLKEGETYSFTYISDRAATNVYLFAPNGNHQVFYGSSTKAADGKYHTDITFTAGKKHIGTDTKWPADQSTDGTYTGTYKLRIDVGNVTETTTVNIDDFKIMKTDTSHLGYRGNHAGVVGDPTYCILFSSSLDRVQYAMVDNGRIYISRSWSRKESTNHIRQLVVGEMDLNAPGTISLNINGKDRQCLYVDEAKMTKFGGGKDDAGRTEMFYMGEALCVMEGYLYMFGESAAWTYYGKDTSSVCPEPIDVIWKIDQFAIMDELRETENEKLQYYEKVTDIAQIKNTNNDLLNTDEYIILYESEEKDPVTQKNILYALDAFGGHNGIKLPKNDSGMTENPNGYSVGIVGHPITEYAIEDGKLYLNNPEKDDVENIRWKFNGTNGTFGLHSTSLYYAKYKNLYYNGNQVFMSSGDYNKFYVEIHPELNYEAYITVDGYFLWGNDGVSNYDSNINNYYREKGYSYTETPGTFHADGLNALSEIQMSNVLGASVSDYGHGRFYIYKRVLDEYAEKETSKVYTNSTATLQPDGTYTVDMETYAISPTHYRIFNEQRPTDFILVLDASASMENNRDTGMTGWHRYGSTNTLSIENVAGEDATKKPSSTGVHAYDYSQNKIYYRSPDGKYRQIYAAVKTTDLHKTLGVSYNCTQYFWAYYKDDAGLCYVLHDNGVVDGGISYSQLQTNVQNNTSPSATVKNNNNSTRKGTTVFTGPHYEQQSLSRLGVMRMSVESLIDKIATEANSTGMKYRVAVVQFGSTAAESYYNTGMYKNDGSFVQYSGSNSISATNYASTFFDVTDATSLQKLKYQVIANIENAEGKDADTYSNHGYEMANNIISNYSGGYDGTGDRSACILMITDGIPSTGKDATDKETVANDAIDKALQAKEKGAYSYTVQMGDSSDDWSSMTTYIEALSSEYLQAQSLTNLGDKNSDEIDYARSVSVSGFNLDELSEELFLHITANSRIGLAQLDTDSILRQTLSDKFYAPVDGANVKYYYADGSYDGLGRIAFDEEVEVTEDSGIKGSAIISADGTCYESLEVRGFDYKENYISKEHGGKKLIVRVTGLLPKTSVVGTNASINNDNKTGIYQTDTMLSADQEFKGFPNETFTIPEYTYVLDYGLQMLDTDVNGTLCSVSDELKAQRDSNGNIKYNDITENGAVGIADNKLDLLYSLSPDKTKESGYTLIKRDDGTYDWFKINVVPASNVYYEETKMSDGAAGKVAWSTVGQQDTANRVLPSVDDPYGWDNAYDNTSPYSNGTALSATLNSSNKNTSTKTFKFTGTGIDIVSACGPTTGVIVVNIKDADGKRVKGYIVDTYYAEGSFNDADLVSQVPVVSWSDTYGTYTVDVAAMYLSSAGAVKATIKSGLKNKLIDTGLVMNSGKPVDNDAAAEMLKNAGLEDYIAEDMEFVWFDDNSVLNGGTGVEPTKKGTRGADPGTAVLDNYIDGFRVYNPLGTDSSLYQETEKNVSYANVINHLATLEGDATELDGIAYIAGSLANGEKLSFANYQSVGPKNELYLNGNNRVSFKITVVPNEKIMLGLRAVNGAVANANISSVVVNDSTKSASYTIKEINSATEMYYDITDCLHSDVRTNGGEVTITISNTDADMLAINHIKFSGASNSVTGGMSPRSVSRSGDTETGVVANRFLPMTQNDLDEIQAVLASEPIPAVVKNGVVTPLVEEKEELPGDNNEGEVPGGDNNEGELPGGDGNEGDVPQNPDNGDTGNGDGSDSTESIFDIFSLLKGLIALIKKILFATVGNESLF